LKFKRELRVEDNADDREQRLARFFCHFCTPSPVAACPVPSYNLIEEMKFLKRNYGVDSIYFWDELQFVKKPWFEEFCRKLISEKVQLKWFCDARDLVREKDVPLLKLARKPGASGSRLVSTRGAMRF